MWVKLILIFDFSFVAGVYLFSQTMPLILFRFFEDALPAIIPHKEMTK